MKWICSIAVVVLLLLILAGCSTTAGVSLSTDGPVRGFFQGSGSGIFGR